MVRYVARMGSAGLGVTALISVALALWSAPALTLLYGEAPAESVFALRALALMYVFSYAISVLQITFRTLERTRVVALSYGMCTLAAVACAYPIVERYGLPGATLGMAAQQALIATVLAVAFLTPTSVSSSREQEVPIP